MTRIFILVYLGVLAVLFAAWYIHGAVSRRRGELDTARVYETAHAGGVRTVARELSRTSSESPQREEALSRIRERFDYPVRITTIGKLPDAVKKRLQNGDDVAYDRTNRTVVGALEDSDEVAVLGPFPNYLSQSIEESLGGWMRLSAAELNAASGSSPQTRRDALEGIRGRFEIPVNIVALASLPERQRWRLSEGADVVFFKSDAAEATYLAATPLANGEEAMRFGPFPSFENIEQKSAATTLALVLLPAAIAIALLLRPVAWQLRHVEKTARDIAAGDLSARVDQRRVAAAKTLAEAFNNMASRTESIVRTQRELVQAVSHELRTPLARMRFAIDLVKSADDKDERQRRLDSLDAATAELDDLVEELLSYVKLETMEPQLSREPIEIGEAFETLTAKHSALFPQISFTINEHSLGEATIDADRRGFQRAIGNLLNNAGRHAQSRVEMTASHADGMIVVDIDDDGPGVAVEDRERVFEPFVRLDDGTNGRGAGLGLALVHRIVTQHQGSVEVLDSPLGGCRMRAVWPVAADSSE